MARIAGFSLLDWLHKRGVLLEGVQAIVIEADFRKTVYVTVQFVDGSVRRFVSKLSGMVFLQTLVEAGHASEHCRAVVISIPHDDVVEITETRLGTDDLMDMGFDFGISEMSEAAGDPLTDDEIAALGFTPVNPERVYVAGARYLRGVQNG